MAELDENYMDSRIWKYAVQHANRERNMDNFKETSLKGHIQLCELRYRSLEEKINAVETKLAKVEDKMSTLKAEMQTGFSEIKLLIERQNNARTIQLIATIGTIAAAIVAGLFAYLK
jgi:chromosome segregation ATPase